MYRNFPLEGAWKSQVQHHLCVVTSCRGPQNTVRNTHITMFLGELFSCDILLQDRCISLFVFSWYFDKQSWSLGTDEICSWQHWKPCRLFTMFAVMGLPVTVGGMFGAVAQGFFKKWALVAALGLTKHECWNRSTAFWAWVSLSFRCNAQNSFLWGTDELWTDNSMPLLYMHLRVTFDWLVVWNMNFIFPYLGNNHPNWLSHIFQRGRLTTNQLWIIIYFP